MKLPLGSKHVRRNETRVFDLGTDPGPEVERYVLCVPGAEAPIYSLDLPSGVSGRARERIAERQLSDILGPEAKKLELHPVSFGKSHAANWSKVIAVDAETSQGWRQDPATKDSRCVAVLPDYLALPFAPGLATIDENSGLVRVRSGITDGFSAPSELAAFLLGPALSGERPQAAWLSLSVPDACRSEVEKLGLEVVTDFDAAQHAVGKAPLVVAAGEDRLDLRVKPGAPVAADAAVLRLSGVAALVSAVAFAIWTAGVVTETRNLERASRELSIVITDTLRKGLIPNGPILDVRQQVTLRLKESSLDDTVKFGATEILHRTANVLFDQNISASSLNTSVDGALVVTLTAPDFSAIDKLGPALEHADLQSEAQRVRANASGGVDAQLLVAGRAGAGTAQGDR